MRSLTMAISCLVEKNPPRASQSSPSRAFASAMVSSCIVSWSICSSSSSSSSSMSSCSSSRSTSPPSASSPSPPLAAHQSSGSPSRPLSFAIAMNVDLFILACLSFLSRVVSVSLSSASAALSASLLAIFLRSEASCDLALSALVARSSWRFSIDDSSRVRELLRHDASCMPLHMSWISVLSLSRSTFRLGPPLEADTFCLSDSKDVCSSRVRSSSLCCCSSIDSSSARWVAYSAR
mmetsp:Transcript_31010/g.76905  ORF Transcript_31010/g.76905 Transcript_31010/m.76905 type:complete len:236 (-) Transcript_31010:12-719(-)